MTPSRATLPCLAVASLLAGATPSFAAQSDDDWDLATDPTQQLTLASVDYAGGVSIVVQCRAGDLQTAILHLPAATGGGAWYDLRLANGRATRASWPRQHDGITLVANANDRLVRFMKGGGQLTLSSDAAVAPPFRLQLDLPSGSSGLDAVLSACGYPTTNDRDHLLSVDELLTGFPRVTVPDRVLERRAAPSFAISISCVIANGRYTACRSERERPPHPVDGQIVANEVNGVRVQTNDLATVEGRVLDLAIVGTRFRRPRSGPGL